MKAFARVASCNLYAFCTFFCTMLCALSLLITDGHAGERDNVTLLHYESLQQLNVEKHSNSDNQKLQAAAGPADIQFNALGKNFDLELQTNTPLLSAMTPEDRASGIMPYRGHIAGNPDSWVRIVVVDDMPSGLIWDGEELFAVEAPGDSVVDTASPIIYRLADAAIAPGTMSCETRSPRGFAKPPTSPKVNAGAMYRSMLTELKTSMVQGPGAVSQIDVGIIGDFEFTNARGSNANAAIVTRMNNVDGIFSQQLGVQINIPTIVTFDNANDPFSDETEAGRLLDELAAYRQNTPAQNSLGLTHLWTGKNLDGTTVGIAFVGAICNSGFGAGLSEGRGNATFDSLIAAHELGHNFGAPHDSTPGACQSTPANFLMAPNVNGSDQFSACSITEMQDNVARAPCITPLPTVDVTVGNDNQAATVLLGNTATVTFDISNSGTAEATNVNADVSLPTNVSLLSAAASVGTCTNGAATASCSLGNIAENASVSVTVTATTTAVGIGNFTATVTATDDNNAGNNQNSVPITVDPAVNLQVGVPTARQVVVNQSTTISATLQNTSTISATNLNLTVTLDSGLRADSATWSIGTCTVAAQQIDCQAASLDAQTSSNLQLGVTGTTIGSSNYTITAEATQADVNPANNSATSSVNVTTAPSGGSGDESGGGVAGFALLFLLTLIGLFRQRSLRLERQ